MVSPFDTIVAPITGVGGAVAIVRLSGPEAWAISSRVFRPWKPEPMRAQYGFLSNGDDGIALPFEEGHSYTGEQSVELSLHASPASVRSLVEDCMRHGARAAEPGEFTQRAFLNGRIDLSQAEAVRDTIEAQTASQLRSANSRREGALKLEVQAATDIIFSVLAAVEASVDFSEEIGELDRAAQIERLHEALAVVDRLISSSAWDRLIREGIRVALVGPPNAGKSSLMNALLRSERSIVTPIPGTTRDFLEEAIEWNGSKIVLIDTAGLREASDQVEAIGIERTREVAVNADLIWFIFDATVGLSPEDRAWTNSFEGSRVVLVGNKSDLAAPTEGLPISAQQGTGLDKLMQTVPIFDEQATVISSRHHPLVMNAAQALRDAIGVLQAEKPVDLATVFLSDALHNLGQITGDTATEDMLQRIFSDFCIGK